MCVPHLLKTIAIFVEIFYSHPGGLEEYSQNHQLIKLHHLSTMNVCALFLHLTKQCNRFIQQEQRRKTSQHGWLDTQR